MSVHVHVCVCVHRAGATGPVLAGPIFVRKRGRVKLCTNAITSVSMRKRRRTHTRANRMFVLDHGVGVVVSIKFRLTKENVLPPGLVHACVHECTCVCTFVCV